MTVAAMLRHPSAFLPLVMSLGALAMVIWFVAAHGVVRQPDESAQARVWQVLMAAQVPVIATFALRWLPRATSAGADRADASARRCSPRGGAGPPARLLTAPDARRASHPAVERGAGTWQSGPKDEGDECQLRRAHRSSDLPATLGREVDAARLESAGTVAVGNRRAKRWRRGIEPPARDRQCSRRDPPPTELPRDRPVALDEGRIRKDHAIVPQRPDPEVAVSEGGGGSEELIPDLPWSLAWLRDRTARCVGDGQRRGGHRRRGRNDRGSGRRGGAGDDR